MTMTTATMTATTGEDEMTRVSTIIGTTGESGEGREKAMMIKAKGEGIGRRNYCQGVSLPLFPSSDKTDFAPLSKALPA